MQGNRHGPTPLTVIGLVIRDRLSIWVPMPTIVYFHSIDTRVDGKCQMPNAECKIGANRNLSKDLAMFHADFTLARSHTLAGLWKLVVKSIFPHNCKSYAVSATSGVPLLFFSGQGAFPTAPKSRKSRRTSEKPKITFTRLELTFATATPPAADRAPKSHGKTSVSLFLFLRLAPSSTTLGETGQHFGGSHHKWTPKLHFIFSNDITKM